MHTLSHTDPPTLSHIAHSHGGARPSPNTRVPAGGHKLLSDEFICWRAHLQRSDIRRIHVTQLRRTWQIQIKILHQSRRKLIAFCAHQLRHQREGERECKLDQRFQFDWRPARFCTTDFSQIIDGIYYSAGGRQFSAPRLRDYSGYPPLAVECAAAVSIEWE